MIWPEVSGSTIATTFLGMVNRLDVSQTCSTESDLTDLRGLTPTLAGLVMFLKPLLTIFCSVSELFILWKEVIKVYSSYQVLLVLVWEETTSIFEHYWYNSLWNSFFAYANFVLNFQCPLERTGLRGLAQENYNDCVVETGFELPSFWFYSPKLYTLGYCNDQCCCFFPIAYYYHSLVNRIK